MNAEKEISSSMPVAKPFEFGDEDHGIEEVEQQDSRPKNSGSDRLQDEDPWAASTAQIKIDNSQERLHTQDLGHTTDLAGR